MASALSVYLDRVHKRERPLSAPQEAGLARRVRQGEDRAAVRALVNAHLGLVVQIAREFRHLYPNLLELIQEGNLALIRAVHRYDPDRPVTLSAYVASWVRTYIERFVLANLGAANDLDRLDDPELTTTALAMVEDEAQGADLLIEARQDQRRLQEALPEFERGLTPREREIFRARLYSEHPATLTEKGADLGLSAERVRQIERDLTDRLRSYLMNAAPRRPPSPAPVVALLRPTTGAPTRQRLPARVEPVRVSIELGDSVRRGA